MSNPSALHVLLDTCAFDSSAHLGSNAMRALSRAVARGAIVMHVPWMVEQEYSRHVRNDIAELARKAEYIAQKLQGMDQLLSEDTQLLARRLGSTLWDCHAAGLFANWLDSIGVHRHPLDADDTRRAMIAYAAATLPFTGHKQKEHIPDAVIREMALRLADSLGSLIVVTNDGNLGDSLAATPSIRCVDDLRTLLRLAEVRLLTQPERKEAVVTWIRNNQKRLQEHIAREMIARLPGDEVSLDPEELSGNEGVLSEVHKLAVDLMLDTLTDYGEGVFGIDFRGYGEASVAVDTWDPKHIAAARLDEIDKHHGIAHVLQRRGIAVQGEAGLELGDLAVDDVFRHLDDGTLDVRLWSAPSSAGGPINSPSE